MQRAPHRIIEPLTNHFPDMQSVLLPSARQRDVPGGGVGLPGHPVAPNPEAAPIAPDAAGHLCHPPAVPCSLQPGPSATRKGRRREGGREVGGGGHRERERMDSSKQKLYPVCESLRAPYSLAEESDRTLQRDSVKEAVDVL